MSGACPSAATCVTLRPGTSLTLIGHGLDEHRHHDVRSPYCADADECGVIMRAERLDHRRSQVGSCG
jgi:hypothetical protein